MDVMETREAGARANPWENHGSGMGAVLDVMGDWSWEGSQDPQHRVLGELLLEGPGL